MRVAEIMRTPAVSCTPRNTIREVANQMADRSVGSVIVIDEVGEVAGIVTDRDIAIRGVAAGHTGDIPIQEIMTRNVASVEPRTDVADAVAVMVKRGVRRLPVVDEVGTAHGLVALDDVVRLVGRQSDELGDLIAAQSSRSRVDA